MRRALLFWGIVLAAAALLALTACDFLARSGALLSGIEPPGPSLWVQKAGTFEAMENSQVIVAGNESLRISLRPYPPRRWNNLELYVETNGKAVEGASVVIAYVMVDMAHDFVPVAATAQGAGTYRARFELPMKGLWQLTLSVERAEGSQRTEYVLRTRNDAEISSIGGHAH